jgi:hypothetical protein
MSALKPKFFNVAGPCDPADHYTLPAFPRLPDVQNLINDKLYFVLHAPRQSGKTTSILAAVDQINAEGAYYALYCSLEELRECTDRDETINRVVGKLEIALALSEVDALNKAESDGFLKDLKAKSYFSEAPLRLWLIFLCKWLKKDLVIFFDEADRLTEQPLLSFLSQLRNGYVVRSKVPFPRSIALISMVNLRDYKVKIRPESETLGSGSPFNVITKALTLANFTPEEIQDLYGQHTAATGQVFLEDAVQRAYYWSEGQPWLVNALAREVVEEILRKDYGPTITADLIDQAADNLMRRQDSHMGSLLNRLSEPRVKRFVEPMLALSLESALYSKKPEETLEAFNDDLQYCLDLGLLKKDDKLRPANPIYANAMVRYLNKNIQDASIAR